MEKEIHFSVQRESLVKQIADQIQKLIIDEKLSPGDKLPSERKLAQILQVSRPVVREALRILSSKTLIEVKQGSGTYVREWGTSSISDSISLIIQSKHSSTTFEHLNEIRRTLEVKIAEFAAKRATVEDIEDMEKILHLMEESKDHAEEFVKADLKFHDALAGATHNELFSVLLTPITDLLLDFRLVAYLYDAPASIQGGLDHHRNILEKIKNKDPDGARLAMIDHLNQAEEIFANARDR